MPECKKCGDHFPSRIKIDGKEHVVNNRKFCLACSPFGKHNTSRNPGETVDEKKSKRRKQWVASVIGYRKKRKEELIAYKGGRCQICGYDKPVPRAYAFHHRDPEEKDFQISGSTRSFKNLKKEADKCDLLCVRCHEEVHHKLELDKLVSLSC